MSNPAAIVISGAASGIGRSVALRAAREAARLHLIDVDRRGLDLVRAEAIAEGARDVVVAQCDVSDDQAVADAFVMFLDHGPITGLFANAGIEVNAPLAEMSKSVWDRVLNINLGGALSCCREAIAAMQHSGGGSIVCSSSPAAFFGFPGGGNSAYAASKGGLSALVRSLAVDHARDGIRVNAVVPGATDTPLLLSGLSEDQRVGARKRILHDAANQIPLGRLGDPAEIANAVWWLLGTESSYVTGSHLVCDGGLMARSANTF